MHSEPELPSAPHAGPDSGPGANSAGSDGRFRVADIWAGIAATAVTLPQAMAFGVALFALANLDSGSAAVAGLIGAAAMSLFSGLLGGTRGLISAPTGPILVLLGGTAAALANTGLDAAGLLTALFLTIVGSGLFQILIGLAGGGRLIKFIPYPVVAGFMTGAAVLMLLSQLAALSGVGGDGEWDRWRWIPAVTALSTVAIMYFIPKWFPLVPNTIAGLIGGTAVFHVLLAAAPGNVPEKWTIGALPGLDAIGFGISATALAGMPWPIIVASAMALAVLASLDTLLTSVIADVQTGARHDARRELVGQGLGQVASGVFGGMAGAGTTGATVVSVKSGGRRWAGVFSGLCFVLVLAFLGTATIYLPIAALAGIIMFVGIGMFERDLFSWLKQPNTRTDAVIAITVATVTVVYDLMVAVGLGVVIAIAQFVRAQVTAPVVHRRSTGSQNRSVRRRTEEEQNLLEERGDRIVLYELRGNLFFATAERLFEELLPDLDRPAWVVLHLRRVRGIDLTGVKILQQMADRLNDHGGRLMFSNVHKGIGIGHEVSQALKNISPRSGGPGVMTFNDSDEALEYAEKALLSELGYQSPSPDAGIDLDQADLCREMSTEQVAALYSALEERCVDTGQKVFEQDEPGDELYIVLRGEVDIRLSTTEHHYKRLAKIGPGTVFGEIAFLEPRRRTAAAIALRPCQLMVLNRQRMEHLAGEHPDVAVAVLRSLSRELGKRLSWADEEVKRLAQW